MIQPTTSTRGGLSPTVAGVPATRVHDGAPVERYSRISSIEGWGQKEENPMGCGGKRASVQEKAPVVPGHIEFLEQPTREILT